MNTFQFGAITPAQAFSLQPDDVIQFSGGSANAASVIYNPPDASGSTITVTFGGHSVTFDAGVINVAANHNLQFADGSLLLIGGPRAEQIEGGAGNDAMFGGDGDDSLNGHEGANVLQGNAGNDTLVTSGGADTIFGGQGDDVIVSGVGSTFEAGDVVNGNKGNDSISGGGGADILLGGQGNDVILGGGGNDLISGDKGDDTLTGGAGADSFFASSDGGDDRVLDFNGAEGDRVHVQAGTVLEFHQFGADTLIIVDHGASTMTLAGVNAATLDLSWFVDDGGAGAAGETITGSESTDVLAGGAGNDIIVGNGGNDWMLGAGGDDTLAGGAGGDVFFAIAHGGDDRALDFNGAEGDRVRVQAGVAFEIHADGNDTLIIIDHGSSTMRLVGVQASTLHADWVVNV